MGTNRAGITIHYRLAPADAARERHPLLLRLLFLGGGIHP
jgi:hypothetical protein